MVPVVIVDDRGPALDVVADLRPVFDVRTGCFTNRQRLEHSINRTADALFASQNIAAIASESAAAPVNELPTGESILLLNGRCVLPPDRLETLALGAAITERDSEDVIAAHLSRRDAAAWLQSRSLPGHVNRSVTDHPCLLHRPWDIIRFRDEAIRRDLAVMIASPRSIPSGVLAAGDQPIQIHSSATVAPGVFLDAAKGPIVIDDGAVIRPGAIVVGPAFIGAHSVVLEHALIKSNTAIGPVCKVAGEVGGTIFQSHSNKGHDGHLGDSWIGQWVNLGAGTTNSNLLNTYGEVTAATSPENRRERTALTFFGAAIGDHVKTAIGTRLMTGSIIGTGAMIASTAPPPTTLRRFAWITDKGEARFRSDRFFETAERMMERRGASITPPMRERLTALLKQDGS